MSTTRIKESTQHKKYRALDRSVIAAFARSAGLCFPSEYLFDQDPEMFDLVSLDVYNLERSQQWLLTNPDVKSLETLDLDVIETAVVETALKEMMVREPYYSKRLNSLISIKPKVTYPDVKQLERDTQNDFEFLEPACDETNETQLDDIVLDQLEISQHVTTPPEEPFVDPSYKKLDTDLTVGQILDAIVPATEEDLYGKINFPAEENSFSLEMPLLTCKTPPERSTLAKIPTLFDPEPKLVAEMGCNSQLADETLSVDEEQLDYKFLSPKGANLYQEIFPNREQELDSPIERCEDRDFSMNVLDDLVFKEADFGFDNTITEDFMEPFADPSALDENIEELAIHELPFPIVSDTGYKRDGPFHIVELPEFKYFEWNLPYFLLYKLNWKPFSNIVANFTEEIVADSVLKVEDIESYEDVYGILGTLDRCSEDFLIELMDEPSEEPTVIPSSVGGLKKAESPGRLHKLPSYPKENWEFLSSSSSEDETVKEKFPSRILTSSILQYSRSKRQRSPSVEIVGQVNKRPNNKSLFVGHETFEDSTHQSINVDHFEDDIPKNDTSQDKLRFPVGEGQNDPFLINSDEDWDKLPTPDIDLDVSWSDSDEPVKPRNETPYNEKEGKDDFAVLSRMESQKRKTAGIHLAPQFVPTASDGLISFSPYFTQAKQPPSGPVIVPTSEPVSATVPGIKKPTARGLQNHFSFSINTSLQTKSTSMTSSSSLKPPTNTTLDMFYGTGAPKNATFSVDTAIPVMWKRHLGEPSRDTRIVVNLANNKLSLIQQLQKHSEAQLIEANLGDDAAHLYLSHQTCIEFFTLEGLTQRTVQRSPAVTKALAMAGLTNTRAPGVDTVAFERLVKLNVSVKLVFAVILVDGLTLSGTDLENLQQLQAVLAPQDWVQSFMIGPASAGANVAGFVDGLALLHGDAGGQLKHDMFERVPARALQFLQFCNVNPVAGALVLRQSDLLSFLQLGSLEMNIKHSDVLSSSQIEYLQKLFTSDWHK